MASAQGRLVKPKEILYPLRGDAESAGVCCAGEGGVQRGALRASGDKLFFDRCESVTIYLDARTNYKQDFLANWREAPMPAIELDFALAMKNSYDRLLKSHIQDVSRLTGAAVIDIGKIPDSIAQLPTNERLVKYAAGGIDPDLEELLFQYGRYLLVSCSRQGGLPANLQRLWNNSNSPAWASDYHNNISIQMNYGWRSGRNLSDCHLPLIDYVVAQAEPCRIATRKAFGASNVRGWTARTSQSLYSAAMVGNGISLPVPEVMRSICSFEHWAYTADTNYLRKTPTP